MESSAGSGTLRASTDAGRSRGWDVVELGPEGMRVNGRLLPHSRPAERDAQGRPVPHAPFGRGQLAGGEMCTRHIKAARSIPGTSDRRESSGCERSCGRC